MSSSRPQDIPALTGLRGVAALWVVLFHMELETPIPIIEKGYLGVDIFFILSGFILMHVYADRKEFNYNEFVRARLARIYPLHMLSLVVLGIIVCLLPGFAES